MTGRTLNKNSEFYGLILTGGKSVRMKTDKAALEIGGQSQARRGFDLLKRHCSKAFVSTTHEASQFPYQKDLPQIHDHPVYKGIGPLAGILSAMEEYPDVPWIILACDLPAVNDKTLEQLIKNRDKFQNATAYTSATDGLPEPLCAIYEPRYIDKLMESVRAGIHCPRKIMINSHVKLIDQADTNWLQNINTPEDYQNFQKRRLIYVQYYAALREQRGLSRETVETQAVTAQELYQELKRKHGFTLSLDLLRVSVNNEFCPWGTPLKAGDTLIFIPPVAGG